MNAGLTDTGDGGSFPTLSAGVVRVSCMEEARRLSIPAALPIAAGPAELAGRHFLLAAPLCEGPACATPPSELLPALLLKAVKTAAPAELQLQSSRHASACVRTLVAPGRAASATGHAPAEDMRAGAGSTAGPCADHAAGSHPSCGSATPVVGRCSVARRLSLSCGLGPLSSL